MGLRDISLYKAEQSDALKRDPCMESKELY